MRWPTVPAPDGKGEMIDQDAVNELVDYAIAHGVNYFDTSPMYVQGWSEKSTGIALKRHPRESFYLATKLSNFHPDTWTREGSIAMYRKSFEDMQVDYIDYYLLHMIGGGGMEQFRKRYIDNGMIDFLVKEREAGRIRRLGWSFHGDIEVYDYALQMHDRGEVHWDFVQIQLNYVDWKHASGSNFKAEYLYDELAKRKIPAVIMEPLLGGRLSNVPDHIVARLKQRQYLVVVVALGYVIECPVLDGLHAVGDIAVGRQQDDLGRRHGLLDPSNHLDTVAVGQLDVAQNHVGIVLPEHFETCGAVGGLCDLVTFKPDDPGQKSAQLLFVVDNQNLRHMFFSVRSRDERDRIRGKYTHLSFFSRPDRIYFVRRTMRRGLPECGVPGG